jgi:hypothetical protein
LLSEVCVITDFHGFDPEEIVYLHHVITDMARTNGFLIVDVTRVEDFFSPIWRGSARERNK